MYENEFSVELHLANEKDAALVDRLASVSKELNLIFDNLEFCKKGEMILSGKRINEDYYLILVYEFYLLARHFKSIPLFAVEVYLHDNIEKIKKLAHKGDFSRLLDLM